VRPQLPKFLILSVAVLLSSCSLFEDCNLGTSAQLPELAIITGTQDVYLEFAIRAEVNNEPRDNDYFYDFIVNDLPPGLDYDQNGRDLTVFGTPTEPGRYFIQVDLVVTSRFLDGDGDGIDDSGQICERRAIRDYAIRIN